MIRALFAAVALVALTAWLASPALAQPVPSASAGISATGFSTASVAAESAELQILLGPSAYFGMGMMESVEISGTPSGEMPPEMLGPMGPVSLSEDQLTPIVEAISAAGILPEAIVTTIPAGTSFMGPGGPETAEIRIGIEQPAGEDLTGLVRTIHDVAPGTGLTVLHVGARYEVADCAALIQQAREAAIVDAESRAEGLATGLGVTLGDLVQANEFPYFGPTGSGSCGTAGPEEVFGPYGPGTEPAFDPNATEASVSIQVTLTYAIEPAV